VQRRVHPDHAEDVTAEAFLTAWRRFDELPGTADDARGWLFGIARNLLLNERRGISRRQALGVRLAEPGLSPAQSDGDLDALAVRLDLARAWSLLPANHQEVLALVVFEDLSAPQGAAVLGISPVAFRLRLSRARRTLRLHLEHPARRDREPEDSQCGDPADAASHQIIERST
jgi:RNA polymerase sigma-70 factor (ECF subfamily)